MRGFFMGIVAKVMKMHSLERISHDASERESDQYVN